MPPYFAVPYSLAPELQQFWLVNSTQSTRAVATGFSCALGIFQVCIGAGLAVFLGIVLQRFALLDSDLMRGFGAGYRHFEVTLSRCLAGVASLVGHVVRVV